MMQPSERTSPQFKLSSQSSASWFYGITWAYTIAIASLRGIAAIDPAAELQEVRDLLRQHLPGVEESALKKSTTEELLTQFGGRVRWVVSSNVSPATAIEAPSKLSARLLEGRFAYVRIPQVTGNTSKIKTELASLVGSNKVQGAVLDLRFSGGSDFASVSVLASLAIPDKRATLDFGSGVQSSDGVPVFGKVPWVVLANRETSGAAEALAVVLRKTQVAALVGGKTSGRASLMKSYPLTDGRRLEIASQRVKTADGEEISAQGTSPDVEVTGGDSVDREFIARFLNSDGTNVVSSGVRPPSTVGTNGVSLRAARRRLNEAELVRMQAEGRRTDVEPVVEPNDILPALTSSVALDSALSRALDLLKALSIFKSSVRE